jgi:hypothetical protein
MATVNIPPGYAQVTYNFTAASGRPGAVVIGVEIGEATPQEVADAASGLFSSTLLNSIPSVVFYSGCRVVIGNDGPPLVAESTNGALPGGNTGQSMVSNTSVLVRKLTEFGGRKFQGRMFLPGPTEGQCDDGAHLTSGGQTGWESSVADFFDEIDNGPELTGMVLLHQGEELPTPITALVVQNLLATQRRRLRK